MGLRDLLSGSMGSGFKRALPWMPPAGQPRLIQPIRLPRDERPHDAAIEWWHFMGYLRHGAPEERGPSDHHKPELTFVVSTMKAQVQGITKLAGIVMLFDHKEKTC